MCCMKKKYIKISIVLAVILVLVSLVLYDATKEEHVFWEPDNIGAYKVNNKLYINGEWGNYITSPCLTSADYKIENEKVIIRLFARSPSLKSPYFSVYVPVSKIPDTVYIDFANNKLDALEVQSSDGGSTMNKRAMKDAMTANKKEHNHTTK